MCKYVKDASLCFSSQVYDSYSLRADSLMGEFKVPGLFLFNLLEVKHSACWYTKSVVYVIRVWLILCHFVTQLDVGYVYDEPGKLVANHNLDLCVIYICTDEAFSPNVTVFFM